ncbi:MAG: aminotransferase class IV family protein [Rhodospirillales bacterium]|nr:aminotransferase class IV family protein [Rhodospirillales bacterium]MBO6787529.1 aminotransferase class IV family protein [Rhodospirillales bacterium]
MKIWLNGGIVDAAKAVDADDRGVTLGDGLFETLAVVDGTPLRFARHVARLTSGAAVLGIPLPVDEALLLQAVREVCAACAVAEGSARVTLLRGPAPRGVLPPEDPAPTLMVTAAPGGVGHARPVRAIVSTCTRRNEQSPLSAVKSTNYLDAILAAKEAQASGADDAVLLNTQGNVAEATAANIFCRFGQDLVTPPVSDGALPGIMRACVLEAETVTERAISADDLCAADEVFLTSSLSIRPVVEIGGQPVGNGETGPVAARLKDLPRRSG